MSETITAKMARQMVAENEKRQQIVKELITETNENIRKACKNGERKSILKDKEKWYDDIYIEVHKHFKKLGYKIKMYRDGSGYYLTW